MRTWSQKELSENSLGDCELPGIVKEWVANSHKLILDHLSKKKESVIMPEKICRVVEIENIKVPILSFLVEREGSPYHMGVELDKAQCNAKTAWQRLTTTEPAVSLFSAEYDSKESIKKQPVL